MSSGSSSFALGHFSRGGKPPFLGVVLGSDVIPSTALLPGTSPSTTLFELLQNWDRNLESLKQGLAANNASSTRVPVSDLLARAPLPESRQVFCTGANYRKHVIEMVLALGVPPETDGMTSDQKREFAERFVARQRAESNPYIFMKSVSSIAGPRDNLVLPEFSSKIDWELELAVVIGAPTLRVSRSAYASSIAGYMMVNDITARDKVKRTDTGALGPDWLASKGAPGFLPMGPYFVPREFIADPHDLGMRLKVNGEVMQDDRTSDMTFDIGRQIECISAQVRMLPGDIICTGSPAGNGIARGRFLKPGDLIEAEIEGLGQQVVRCMSSVPQ